MRLAATFAWAALTLLAACTGGDPGEARGRVVVLGDSVLAWNGGAVARGIASATGREVESRAVSGARVSPRGGLALTRFRIANQMPRGGADWAVVNGGANDLIATCGCRACGAAVARLISENGLEGPLPELWRGLKARGAARVLIVGYYNASRGRTRFSGCHQGFDALDARAALFAARHDWAEFVDAGAVMTPAMIGPDRVHPGPNGSAAIAGLVAGVIGPDV